LFTREQDGRVLLGEDPGVTIFCRPPPLRSSTLHDLTVELMWGVCPERLLGQAQSEKLHAVVWNRDLRPIRPQHRARSAGAQSALGREQATEAVFKPALLHLGGRVASRLRAKETVTVRVRFANMRAVTWSMTLNAPIAATTMLAEIAEGPRARGPRRPSAGPGRVERPALSLRAGR
jgi:DNA polymerase-4